MIIPYLGLLVVLYLAGNALRKPPCPLCGKKPYYCGACAARAMQKAMAGNKFKRQVEAIREVQE